MVGGAAALASALPVVAAVLLIIDRSEPSRFLVLWTSNVYWLALALLLLGVWLFLWSHRSGSRTVLVLSCLMLGGSLSVNEAAYPLAILAPVLAWSAFAASCALACLSETTAMWRKPAMASGS